MSDGNDSVQYATNYTVSLSSEDYETKLSGDNLIFVEGTQSLTVIDGKGKDIKVNINGKDTTINKAYDFATMMTYNSARRTAVTLNGADEAADNPNKKEFTAITLPSNGYDSTVVSIKASDSMDEVTGKVYIEGNANDNVITANNLGNTLDGGKGSDTLYGGTLGSGADLFIYDGQGNDVIYRYDSASDMIKLGGVSDFTTVKQAIDGNDIVYTFGEDEDAPKLTVKNVFGSTTTAKVSLVGSNDEDVKEYNYRQSGAIIDGNNVTVTGNTYAITKVEKTSGVTIYGYSEDVTLTGLQLKEIKTTSADESGVTLGLSDKASIVFNGASSVNIGGKVYGVGTNCLSNNGNYILTASATEFEQADSTGVTIDAGFTRGATLTGNSGDDVLIGSAYDDKFTGNGGSDTFVYSGGKDTITDYAAGDTISLAANVELDFTKVSFGEGESNDVIIGEGGNQLTIKNGDGVKLTVNDADGNPTSYSYKKGDPNGILNEEGTSIILFDKTATFDGSTSTYSQLETIDGSAVTTSGAITGNDNDNTIISGAKDVELTGNGGADIFVYGGGNDKIKDYSVEDGDEISLSKSISDLSGVTVGNEGGVTLSFGDDASLTLETIDAGTKVTINGNGYIFEDDKVLTENKRGVTVVSAMEETYDLSNNSEYATVMANAGGTIKGGAFGRTMGGKDVTLIGGSGAETFVYAGGNVTVTNYTFSNDHISLASGYSITASTVDGSNAVLTVSDENDTVGTITVEGVTNKVKLYVDGVEKKMYFTGGTNSFNSETLTAATAVSVGSATGDFGTNASVDSNLITSGAEYYSALQSITADKEDSTLVGNAKANTFYIAGGTENILTGGIGADKYEFNNGGGGVITDFGVNATKTSTTYDGGSKAMTYAAKTTQASTSSYLAYNRNNPTSYAQGQDVLKVNGTVVEIAFAGHGDANSKNTQTFTAYVTYEAADDGEEYTVALANIVKAPNTKVYKTDDVAAKTLKIWDTSGGGMASLTSAALNNLFVTKEDSSYDTNINALDDLIETKQITTYGENDSVTATSNGLEVLYTNGGNNNNNNG